MLQSHVAGPSYAVILQGIFKVILSFYTNEDLYSVFTNYDLQHCSLCMFLFFVVSNAMAITV